VLRDPARIAALQASGLLERRRHDALEQLATLAARTMHAPLAQVNLLTGETLIPLAAATRDGDDAAAWRVPVPVDASLCQHVVATQAPLAIADARLDPLVRDSQATVEGGVVAYIAAPVFAPDGQPLGSVCVVDFAPREWTAEELATIRDLAALASRDVALVVTATQALQAADRELAARAGRLDVERAHLLAVIEQLPLGIALAEPGTGRLLLHNAAATRLLGHALRDSGELRDYLGYGAVHPDGTPYAPTEYPLVRAAMAGERVEQHEMRYRRGDGRVTVLSVSAAPVRDAAGTLVTAVSVFDDIGARKRAEESAEQARAEAEAARREAESANRAKSEFLAVMSHELRTPLNAIGGYAQLLEMGVRGPVTVEQREDLARIQRSQQHLLGLINEVLNYAKLETGAVRYEITRVPVAAAFAGAEGLIAPQAQARGLQLTVVPSPPDAAVRADADKLRQILVNLLSNAIKFTGPAGA
jgi:signal transduction histidine kinase